MAEAIINPIRAKELAAVQRGVALLDQVKPNWFTKFKQRQFDLSEPNQCALGQVYGEYTKGLQRLAEDGIAQLLKASGLKFSESQEVAFEARSIHTGEQVDPELDGEYYGFDVEDRANGGNLGARYERMGGAWLYFAAQRSKKAARARKRQAALNG